MILDDNQVLQCSDGYVMTSPWHDTEGHIVTPVIFRISGKTNAIDSILVSILPYSRQENSKMMKLFM